MQIIYVAQSSINNADNLVERVLDGCSVLSHKCSSGEEILWQLICNSGAQRTDNTHTVIELFDFNIYLDITQAGCH